MRLMVRRRDVDRNACSTLYFGSPSGLDEEHISKILNGLESDITLLNLTSCGAVKRDKRDTSSWIKWYLNQQSVRFNEEVRANCDLYVSIILDSKSKNLNIVCTIGQTHKSGISYRSYVYRVSDDEYACFEY